MKEIVITDGSVVNDYGFRVRTSGIILSRFLKNPVMLNDHCRELDDILGRWENVREEGLQLIGTPVFNSDDPEIKLIADAYEKGFINAASIGYDFDEEDFELMPDGIWELTKCILYEVSLVSIPSNDSAVCLYSAKTKQRVTKEEFQTLSAHFNPNKQRQENKSMAKMVLSAGVLPLLGLTMQENEVEVVETAIKQLSSKLESAEGKISTLSDEVETFKKKELEAKKLAAKTLVDKAEADGKILAKDKPQFVEMAETNFQLASNVLGAMPSRNVLSAKQQGQAGGQVGEQEETYDYLSKHNPTRLASIKASDPERFATLESAYLASKK